jgi:streptogramin lyase
MIRRWLAAAALVALGGCGGSSGSGGSGLAPAPPVPSSLAQLDVVMRIPLQGAYDARHRWFIASQTSGVAVTVGSGGSTAFSGVFDVSASSSSCSTSSGTRTCTLILPVPPGTYAATFTSYDQAPVSGAIPNTAHQLAIGTATATIVAATLNTVNVTMLGTPASVKLAAPSFVINGDAAGATTLGGINVLDADANVIVGAFSAPVAAGIADAGNHSTLKLGASLGTSVSLSSPADVAALAVQYDGAGGSNYSAVTTFTPAGGTSATLTLNTFTTTATVGFGSLPTYTPGAPAKAAFSAPSQQLIITPHESNFSGTFSIGSNTCGGVASVAAAGAAFSVTSSSFGTCSVGISDGSTVYAVAVSANLTQGGVVVPPASGTINEYVDKNATSVAAITVGSDGNLWYVGVNGGNGLLGKITTAGNITDTTVASTGYVAIASGSDGHLWVADETNAKLISYTTAAVQTLAVSTGGNPPIALTNGPDGNLWASTSNGDVFCTNTSGTLSRSYPIPLANTTGGIAAGPDGGIWVPDAVEPFATRYQPSCGGLSPVTQYGIPSKGGSNAIVAGSDGALWIAGYTGKNGLITRMDTQGLVSIYNYSGGSLSTSETLGPDRNVWLAGCGCGIATVTPGGVVSYAAGFTGSPTSVVAGPDGGIWYVSNNGTNAVIGRYQP